MSNSLRDQLLGLGYKPAPEAPKPPRSGPPRAEHKPQGEAKARPDSRPRPPGGRNDSRPRPEGKPGEGRRPPHKPGASAGARRGPPPAPKSGAEFDLGKAYALRAQKEKDERIAAEAAKQEQARLRREARAKLTVLLEGKSLNDPAAEHVRHFEYGGKIKRVHVTAEQLTALNRGELGVLQSDGRYLLVDAATLAAAEAVFADAIALKVDPNAPAADDPYSDPAYQVPDDLIW
jgi:uncharacterized protein YaiL (DUF2058 family)